MSLRQFLNFRHSTWPVPVIMLFINFCADKILLGPGRTRIPLTLSEKKQIIAYHRANPDIPKRQLCDHFSEIQGRPIPYMTLNRLLRNCERYENISDTYSDDKDIRPEKERVLMAELYSKFVTQIDLGLTKVYKTKEIRSLAIELASHEKYEGFFESYKFGDTWMKKWRKLYNVPAAGNPASQKPPVTYRIDLS